jgi:outer membrane biosynthesis protein TonB
MSIVKRRATLGLMLAISIGASGCAMFSVSGPSSVAQGKHYASGNRQFDEFFLELYRLQVRLAAAPDELANARMELAKAAAAEPRTPNAELADKLHAHFEGLIARGIRVKIEVQAPEPPDPKATAASLKSSGNPSSADRASFTAVESALTSLLQLHAEMKLATPRLAELQLIATQLDGQIDQSFDLGGLAKRREVRQNLQDSLRVIALMLDRAKVLEAESGELAMLVAEKAGTDDGSVGLAPTPAPTQSEPAPRAEPEPKPAPRPAAPRAAPAPRPAPAAPAPPKPKEAPKPAEFEP